MRDLSFSDAGVVRGTYLELVRSVLSTLIPTSIMGLLFVLVAVLAIGRHQDALLFLFAIAGTFASIARIAILLKYSRSFDEVLTIEHAARFERVFGTSYIAFAILLGLFAGRAMQVCEVDTQMVIASLVVGYAAGVAAGVSLRPRISLVALTCSVLPVAFASASKADAAHTTLAIVLVALLAGGMSSMLKRYKWTSEAIAMRHLLDSLARRDPLTGLPNRLELSEAFQTFQNSAENRIVALHFLDLDGFKPVNDTYGHPVGDRLLQLVAERLAMLCSDADVAVRLGGDEFALLQTRITYPDEVELVRRRIAKVLAEPYTIGEQEIIVGVSVGSATSRTGMASLQALLSEADTASYKVKAASRSHLSPEARGAVWLNSNVPRTNLSYQI